MVVVGFLIYCLFSSQGNDFPWDQFFGQWIKWDSNSYIKIPEGYSSRVEDGDYVALVFFPMYSWIMKIFMFIIPNANAAALFTSSICYSTACVYMYKLCCVDYSREAAKKAVVLISVFPFGFFFGAIMSESTFFMTSVMTLYYIRKHNWVAAGIAGMCAALSRSAGVFLIIPATVEFIEEYKLLENIKNVKQNLLLILKKWSFLLLLPLGTCVYLYINYRVAGDPFDFLRLEEKIWHQTSQPFFKTVSSLWDIISSKKYSVSVVTSAFLPGTLILFLMYGIMLSGIKKTRNVYLTWLFVYVIINTTMSWPLSLGRYLSCAVPAFMILGDACDKNKKLNFALMMGFGILMGIYYVGYMTGKQIM